MALGLKDFDGSSQLLLELGVGGGGMSLEMATLNEQEGKFWRRDNQLMAITINKHTLQLLLQEV